MSKDSRLKAVGPAELVDLQQQVEHLQVLQQISLLAATCRDRNQLLEKSLLCLKTAFQVNGCGIYQLHDPDSPLHLVAEQGIDAELVRELQKVPAGQGLIAQVVQSGSPQTWSNLAQEPQLYCQATLAAGWCSLLAHPLFAHDQLLGVVFLFQQTVRQFSQQEIALLGNCCQILAAAIDSSELLEKLEWQHRLTHASQRELDRSRRQLREHVSRLEESNRSLEQANQMKDRFLALASHELRTPLTWIITATELLEGQRHELPPESRALLETIFKGGRRLNSLVEDLLEMARIESRDIYLAQETVDLSLLLNELALQYRDEILRRQLTLELELGSLTDQLSPVGDHYHLRIALERILKNALKFTPPEGKISLSAGYISSEELVRRKSEIEPFCPEFFRRTPLHDHLDICIIDSGVGIAEQDRLLIFDKFHGAGDISLHGKQRNSIQGPSAGLGLPLAKGMIEAHGGMIWLENAPGSESGSCFHVLLPLHQPTRGGDDKG